MNKKTIKTFQNPSRKQRELEWQSEPYCINEDVCVIQYKVTVEIIEEKKETYRKRLQKLYNETTNDHHWRPIRKEAKRLGIELQNR